MITDEYNLTGQLSRKPRSIGARCCSMVVVLRSYPNDVAVYELLSRYESGAGVAAQIRGKTKAVSGYRT